MRIILIIEAYFNFGITMLGMAAFTLFLSWEYASFLGANKIITGILKGLSITSGIVSHILILTGPRFPGKLETTIIGALIICLAGYLLYRSLIAELPRETYSMIAQKPSRRKTCRHGTYALVRHPALWWYGLFLVGLFILSGAKWLIISGLVWWITNLLLVVIEDFYLYPRMFQDYLSYKRKAPMLIPSSESLSRCLKTWTAKY